MSDTKAIDPEDKRRRATETVASSPRRVGESSTPMRGLSSAAAGRG
jgi:hypothetical protein